MVHKVHMNITGSDESKSIETFLSGGSPVDVLKKFIPLVLLLACFFGAGIFTVTSLEHIKHIEIRKSEEAKYLELMISSLLRDLEVMVSDLRIIAGTESLDRYINEPSAQNKENLQSRFSTFITDRNIYSQLRYIAADGQEIVRINKNVGVGEAVPAERLQNKKQRYYFEQTARLKKNEVYLSNLDLNIEMGQVERPFVPVLRIATPLFTHRDEFAGIVILNYRAELMLDRFVRAKPKETTTRYSLVNQDGYWLKADDPLLEWGFMLHSRKSFSREFPDEWEHIVLEGNGEIATSRGLFMFQMIEPEKEVGIFGGNQLQITGEELLNKRASDSWYVICHVPEQDLSYLNCVLEMKRVNAALLLLFLLLTAGAWQVAAAKVDRRSTRSFMRLLGQGLEQSPAAVVITDRSGNISYVNPKFERMSGYDATEVIGNNPRMFKSGKTQNGVYAELWTTITGGGSWRGSFENLRKDQVSYYVDAQISPIVNERGKIEYFIAVQEDVTQKVELQRQLEKLATIDTLTGAYTRGYFMSRCRQELKRLVRYSSVITVLLLDIDYFKNINDTYGHHGGDRMLRHFGSAIHEGLRDSDLFGRLGGEEFAVLLIETDRAQALLLAERLRRTIEAMEVPFEGQTIRATVSIGCSGWQNGDGSVDDMLKRADIALYAAKNNGRNRVEAS
jgi:diguanylate cyclase (GGDEF)-like protein/PAS domain S-box-containing protein